MKASYGERHSLFEGIFLLNYWPLIAHSEYFSRKDAFILGIKKTIGNEKGNMFEKRIFLLDEI
jgi:hypothetical protein